MGTNRIEKVVVKGVKHSPEMYNFMTVLWNCSGVFLVKRSAFLVEIIGAFYLHFIVALISSFLLVYIYL